MAFTRPTDLPEFCTDGIAVEEPSGAKKTIGWEENEAPPHDWFNWLHNLYYRWLGWTRDGITCKEQATIARHSVYENVFTCSNVSVFDSDHNLVITIASLVKNIQNGVGWVAGANNNSLAAGITLAPGDKAYIFAICLPDGSFDIGIDTDIDATNLIADSACQCEYFRRISTVFVDTIVSTTVNVFQFTHDQFGLYSFSTPIEYSKSTAGVDSTYWLLSEIAIPEDFSIEVSYTVAPPSGGVNAVFVLPEWLYTKEATSYAANGVWQAAGSIGAHRLRMQHRLGSNGMWAKASTTGVTVLWSLNGFIDNRNE